MEHRHREALRRIYQADRMLQEDGREPEQFVLYPAGGPNGRKVLHARWNSSWAAPSAETIDDLGELELLRVEAPSDLGRKFSLTMQGRDEARAIDAQAVVPQATGGSAPTASEVLMWLFEFAKRYPNALDSPADILDLATREGFIRMDGRDALAARILRLIEEGYLQGDVPELAHGTPSQRLAGVRHLQFSMKATEVRDASTGSTPSSVVNIMAGQIALGDIANYVTFGDVLDRAEHEVDALTEDEETRSAVKRLIDQMRGSAATASGQVVTGTVAGVAATAVARALGFI